MGLKTILFYILAICSSSFGTVDIPFFDDSPICSDKLDNREEVPVYDFDKPLLPFEKRMETVFYPDMSIPLSYLRPFSNDQEIQFASRLGSPDAEFNSHIHLRKRSISNDDDSYTSNGNGPDQYDTGIVPPLLREKNKNIIKTIHLPSAFTPRLGRKRSSENPKDQDIYKTHSYAGRARVIDLQAGNAFTPRLGRSEGPNKIHLYAGNNFTPRLGRSEGPYRIRVNAGNAFTPRLGRSDNPNRILLNAGSTFIPRLGRSEGSNRIYLNGGGAFTPRLGRSNSDDESRLIQRYERSENRNKIQLNAGRAFTPRLG